LVNTVIPYLKKILKGPFFMITTTQPPWLYRLYRCIFPLLLPLVLGRLLWKSRKDPAYRERLSERLGFLPFHVTAPVIWIHAVSLGEVVAGTPFIESWLRAHPHDTVLVTTTTPTGSNQVKKTFGDRVKHSYFPYDTLGCIRRFFAHCEPRVLIVLETELWPVLFDTCHQRQIPIFNINGRISDKAWPRYERIRPVMRYILPFLQQVFAQSQANGERFLKLGLTPNQLTVMGNLKFDVKPPNYDSTTRETTKTALHANAEQPRFVWVAASTHPGEEAQLLDILPALMAEIPSLLLVLIPRHPHRFEEVATLIKGRGIQMAQRTRQESCTADTLVYLADTLGEVPLFYGLADIAFVGGSLVPIGGHSLLEPTFAGLPVLSGPHNENAQEIAEYLATSGILTTVKSKDDLGKAILHFAQSPAERKKCHERGLDIMHEHKGSSEKTREKIMEYLKKPAKFQKT
jgi:3-deoxy-D-manno-octulosonic-acid transferase